MDIKLKNNNKKKIIFLVLTIIMCLGVSLGAVYFIYLYNDERENTLETGLISIAYTEGSESIVLENQVPVIDDIGLTNTPYEFTVQNTSKVPINVKFQIIPENNNQIPLGAVRYGLYINDELMEKDNLGKSDDNTFYILENFEVGATIQAKLVFWVDYYYETPGETFSAKIKVTGESFDVIVEEVGTDTLKKKLGTGGLVAINSDGDLYDATDTTETIREYRYSGLTVDNYAYFNCQDTDGTYAYGDLNYDYKNNCELWRIIGIFNDNGEDKIKLVRNTTLTADELPESYLINGTTYTIENSTTSSSAYWNYVPSGTYPSTNKNDWTTAGLQYYLNTEKDETDTSDGTTTANAGYLSLLTNEAKEMISPTTYYLGNVDYNVSTVKLSYNQERDETRLWSGNQASWDGLIGLMYPSDYGYSASDLYWETYMYGWDSAEEDGVYARSTSWLYQTANHSSSEWLLSPSSNSSGRAVGWYSAGYVYSYFTSSSYGARPVLNLKSQAKVIDGVGTEEEPFVFVID
ncbi:MAG: hypothetical protein IJ501_04030 [Bacilli bacterium]|nr:hypothetical protein [Bacilli bacterium]